MKWIKKERILNQTVIVTRRMTKLIRVPKLKSSLLKKVKLSTRKRIVPPMTKKN